TIYAIGNQMNPGNPPDGRLMTMAFVVISGFPLGVLLYQWSFEIKRWQGSDFSPYGHGVSEIKKSLLGDSI
ncbi:MAG: hypothetical protein ACKOAU_12205, partial [Pirellula sp.]